MKIDGLLHLQLKEKSKRNRVCTARAIMDERMIMMFAKDRDKEMKVISETESLALILARQIIKVARLTQSSSFEL
ncbi:hypothetical protein HI914_03852 [Erysiphe necator]|nr:hypothetical protein HI914_03852 [Erysiphe necator]